MRLRNKPWAKEKLMQNPKIVIQEPEHFRGRWSEAFAKKQPLHIEIGTGKGRFITGMAKQNPHINYIGIEKQESAIVSALDKILEEQLDNVKLLNVDASRLVEYFQKNDIERVYLNFSDPWPKNRHEKRRLTYKSFLRMYESVLVDGGEIHFKTDNQGLFEYSLKSFSEYGLLLKDISLDLHNSGMEDNVMTEYEEKFSAKGQRIYRCEVKYLNE
ncbi:tRNA (guanosine(46)-N7)-methyltransferase TrmB [Heyndrickxia ginsengihumi]|uniref:tRNA (guanine-N(7)-)-methyltransferase n=1 Tax=Heyndrickxia ginsengihumi TaxID=363870 RepID=A0A0A6VEC4_9BACI|nr:tRNA (guanosine(46)-N7)-methyltransferase TrmB [Heyndrickxia ginsengihumi]KHD85931.1 tRNA (guanine-N7)-methyltransferase [Heyndrickxia ginsengihumi]MBE6185036.1 tRNA (guanosine(46)-N7)-methyltransferase TrmB [Bacillus sp. (in: firmicutes)]MCM3022067.1 tRNA (guanosine(46)-N7)-methyltransferase TrmB [Heyndrickxia ginsengihumi]